MLDAERWYECIELRHCRKMRKSLEDRKEFFGFSYWRVSIGMCEHVWPASCNLVCDFFHHARCLRNEDLAVNPSMFQKMGWMLIPFASQSRDTYFLRIRRHLSLLGKDANPAWLEFEALEHGTHSKLAGLGFRRIKLGT